MWTILYKRSDVGWYRVDEFPSREEAWGAVHRARPWEHAAFEGVRVVHKYKAPKLEVMR